MAGTISLSMSQQLNAQGVPLVGGKLYFFQAGTTSPQSAYSDSGLTTALPNPLTLDGYGRVPSFYLADGSIKVRLTDATGVVQLEVDNLLVVGPSSGGGGGGSNVDTTAIFGTGDTKFLEIAGTISGWVRDNGRTIGSAISGATERANADCQNLFTWLWNNFADAQCPVSGGRGASAAADWSANKTITLIDKRGRINVGLADMGNTDSGRLANVAFAAGNATTAGSTGGEALHILASTEIPSHSHTITDPGHYHNLNETKANVNAVAGVLVDQSIDRASASPSGTTDVATTGITGTDATGGGNAHNNMQPFILGTWFRKL